LNAFYVLHPMDAPQPSGWRKTHTWFFSGVGTMILSLIVALFITRKPSEVARDELRFTPTPASISPLPQNPPPTTNPAVEHTPSVAESKTEIDTAKRRAEEKKAEQLRAEIQLLEEQRDERMRVEAQRLEQRRAAQTRAENERLEKQKEEIRREEERARQETANTWHVARVRNRARVTVNYSVLSDGGEWKPYTVAPGATAGHGRHGDVIIEFDPGGGRSPKRLTLNSSTVRAAQPSKADQDSAPASYFGVLSDGSLGIFPR
jgi:hypothetical protein